MHRSKQKPGLISQNQPQVWNINLYTAYISVWTLKGSFGNIMDMFLRHYWLHAHASELYWPKQKFQSFIPIHLLKMNEKEDIQNLLSIRPWMTSFTVYYPLHILYMFMPVIWWIQVFWSRHEEDRHSGSLGPADIRGEGSLQFISETQYYMKWTCAFVI